MRAQRRLPWGAPKPYRKRKAFTRKPTDALFSLGDPELNQQASEIMKEFYQWADKQHHTFFLMCNFEKDQYRVMRRYETTRYHSKGLERIKKKIKQRMGRYYSTPALMLTLQFDGNRFNAIETWERMKGEVSRMLDAVNVAHKRRGWSRLKHYIAVVEPQPQSNRCHMHMVFPRLKYLDYKLVKRHWGNGFVHIEYRDNVNLVGYACKYISKFGLNDFAKAMLWRFKVKLYTFSHSFKLDPLEKATGWFVYLSSDLKEFLERVVNLCGYESPDAQMVREALVYGYV